MFSTRVLKFSDDSVVRFQYFGDKWMRFWWWNGEVRVYEAWWCFGWWLVQWWCSFWHDLMMRWWSDEALVMVNWWDLVSEYGKFVDNDDDEIMEDWLWFFWFCFSLLLFHGWIWKAIYRRKEITCMDSKLSPLATCV